MEERKTGGKLKTALIAVIMLAIGIFVGFGIVFYFQGTKPTSGNSETELSSEEVYQYALEYLKHANEDAAEPEAIEYSTYSSDAVSRFPTTEELSNEDEYVSEGYSPLHHHGYLNEDGQKQVSALKTADSSPKKDKADS